MVINCFLQDSDRIKRVLRHPNRMTIFVNLITDVFFESIIECLNGRYCESATARRMCISLLSALARFSQFPKIPTSFELNLPLIDFLLLWRFSRHCKGWLFDSSCRWLCFFLLLNVFPNFV